MRISNRLRGDDGAVAIIVSLMATMLLVFAAFSVDLGNAWARKRHLQTQVDVAALSAGHWLPADTASKRDSARAEVFEWLKRSNNAVSGQHDFTVGDLDDDIMSNGEVDFLESDFTQMRVVAPAAWVDFGLASAAGFPGRDVQAVAVVELQSQIPFNVLPFAVPSGCPFGPGFADTGPGGPPASPAVDADYSPSNGETGSHSIVSGPNPGSVPEGASPNPTVSVVLTGLPQNTTQAILRFRLGSSTVASFQSAPFPSTGNNAAAQTAQRTATVTLDSSVTAIPGNWRIWAIAGNSNKYSTNSVPFEVVAAEPPPPTPDDPTLGCAVSEEGNYGQLDSPGWGLNSRQPRFAYNIAAGLDHTVIPFDPDPGNDVCATGDAGNNNLLPGARLDKDPLPPRPNCLNIDDGNDGPYVMKGLVTGAAGVSPYGNVSGRLNKKPENETETTECPNPTRAPASDVTINGIKVNNDKIACFLSPGVSLSQIAQPGDGVDPAWLDPSITDSPRFVWIPVIRSVERVGDKWQPIKTFVPGLITSEGATNPADPDDDGIEWTGNSITSIQVFTFNPLLLPEDEQAPSVDYDPTLGLNTVLRLVK